MREGFIVKVNAGLYDVFDGEKIVQTRAAGKLRIGDYTPFVGDNVCFDENTLVLESIKPRINELVRPPLANVETVVVVASAENPAIPLSLICRYIVISEIINVKPIIVLTKIDIDGNNNTLSIKHELEKIGYKVYPYSSKTQEGLDDIIEAIDGKRVVFFGQSGVGKSSLINLLIPGSRQKTNDISKALGRGKHTTRIVEYLPYKNSWLADTPGFSHIQFDLNPVDIACYYPGFDKYYSKCKFRNCLHLHEKECAVKVAVENKEISQQIYDDYLSLLTDLENKKVFK